jgi:RNA polymerase sigma-70 factor (ECF subfamily)
MKGDDQNDLVKNLRNDDKKAFEVVFNSLYTKLFNFTKGYVVDHEVARELVQEAFIKLWEVRKTLNPDTNIQAFLFTITRNSALNYLKHIAIRKSKEASMRKQQYELELNYYALLNSTEEKMAYDELKLKIDKAVNKLPDKCKQIFMFSRFDGLKHKEIAEKLNISVSTIETQITIALKRLKKELKNYL